MFLRQYNVARGKIARLWARDVFVQITVDQINTLQFTTIESV